MTIWFTADTHFGHANIIKYCNRPFATADEMDEAIISRWNAIISPDDEVWHLGDFAWPNKMPKGRLEKIFHTLNGRKHLVRGNHDPSEVRKLPWASVSDYRELRDHRIVMSHYAMEDWNGAFHGSVMLHGHSHGKARQIEKRFDVGVDCWSFAPVSLDEIKAAAL